MPKQTIKVRIIEEDDESVEKILEDIRSALRGLGKKISVKVGNERWVPVN